MDALKKFTGELLDAKRLSGDEEADLLINSLFNDPIAKQSLQANLKQLDNNTSLQTLAQIYTGYKAVEEAGKLPPWANKKLMRRGAAFFANHSQLIMNMLGLLSLPYCYTAANGAMVLYLSDRMRADAGTRLVETADFVWEVMAPNAFDDTGKGFSAILKVRLMHAAVRYYTLNSGKWDNSMGVPINQEDMAGTNLSFSLIAIRGLRKFGLSVAYEAQQAFTHLWNVIGFLLGLDESLIPQTGKEAYSLEEAIRVRQFRPSEQGQFLTKTLIDYFISVNTGAQFSNSEIMQVMRYLLGTNVADTLGLPAETLAPGKIRLLKLVNLYNAFKLNDNAALNYKSGYSQFNKSKPAA